jgi:hypothetical protein
MNNLIKSGGRSNGKQFSSEYQASPEAKKLGWKRKHLRKALLQDILEQVTNGKTNYDQLVDVLSLPLKKKQLTVPQDLLLKRAWDIVNNLTPREVNLTSNGMDKIEVILGETAMTQGELEI